MDWRGIMDRICSGYRDILGENLLGIYVHGSIAFGCYNPHKSDIDFLVVTERAPDLLQKQHMLCLLMQLAPCAPEKGIEMSVVLRRDCRDFSYPTPYQLHYSAAHHAAYEQDLAGHCLRLQGTDADLAAHFTVTRAVGIALIGPEPQEMFAPVPPEDYLASIRYDVESAAEDVRENPVYVILNLCRVLAYMREGAVISKAQGGLWGLQRLPQQYHGLLTGALNAYRGDGAYHADAEAEQQFVNMMLNEIFLA